jgi:serine/threonine protein kinase
VRILGDFRLLREIGRGGMGVVYEAEQTSLRRRVALKLLPEVYGLPPEAVERFERESQILARIQHPGVVEVHWAGVIDGTHCLAMRLIDGVSLDRLVRDSEEARNHPLFEALADSAMPGRFRLVARIGLLAAEALAAVHAAGIVHRDVKPANLMLSPDGSVVLTDFGLAKDLCARHGLTRSLDYLGTAKYSAPEAIEGNADARSDVYSLGATLRELWTLGGASPPRRDSSGLSRVLARATNPDPTLRHATAEELAGALRAIAEGSEPVDTRSDWRGRVAVAACGLVAVAILAVWSFTGASRRAVPDVPTVPAAARSGGPETTSPADAAPANSPDDDAPRLQLISTTRRAYRGALIEAIAFDKHGQKLIAGGGGAIDVWAVRQDEAARRIADNRGAILRIVRAPSSNRFVAMVAADEGADGERQVVFDFFSLTDDIARRSGLIPLPIPVDEPAGFPSFQVVEQADAVLVALREGPKLLEVAAKGTADLSRPVPDGTLVAVSLSDEAGLPCATLWDNGLVRFESETGTGVRNRKEFHLGADAGTAIHFSTKPDRLICAGSGGARVVDLETGVVGDRIPLPANLTTLRFVPNAGRDRVMAVGEHSVALLDTLSLRVLWSAESADSRFIAVESTGDRPPGRELHPGGEVPGGPAPGSDDFLLVEANGRVRFLESATGRERDGERTIRPEPVLVAWSRESRVLATADNQGTLSLYRVVDRSRPETPPGGSPPK